MTTTNDSATRRVIHAAYCAVAHHDTTQLLHALNDRAKADSVGLRRLAEWEQLANEWQAEHRADPDSVDTFDLEEQFSGVYEHVTCTIVRRLAWDCTVAVTFGMDPDGLRLVNALGIELHTTTTAGTCITEVPPTSPAWELWADSAYRTLD